MKKVVIIITIKTIITALAMMTVNPPRYDDPYFMCLL
jgi:hypothetical protein